MSAASAAGRRPESNSIDRPIPVRPPSVVIALVGLAIAYLPQYSESLLDFAGIQRSGQGPTSVIPVNWLAAALVVLYVIGVERQGLASLLITRPSEKDIEWAFYLWGAAMTWYWLASLIWPITESTTQRGVDVITAEPAWAVVALVITVAVCEEFLIRGYASERIGGLLGRRWAGALITGVVFVLAHLPFFGVDWLLYFFPGTLAIYVLYLWKANLVACIVLHLLLNIPILIPTMLGSAT